MINELSNSGLTKTICFNDIKGNIRIFRGSLIKWYLHFNLDQNIQKEFNNLN